MLGLLGGVLGALVGVGLGRSLGQTALEIPAASFTVGTDVLLYTIPRSPAGSRAGQLPPHPLRRHPRPGPWSCGKRRRQAGGRSRRAGCAGRARTLPVYAPPLPSDPTPARGLRRWEWRRRRRGPGVCGAGIAASIASCTPKFSRLASTLKPGRDQQRFAHASEGEVLADVPRAGEVVGHAEGRDPLSGPTDRCRRCSSRCSRRDPSSQCIPA